MGHLPDEVLDETVDGEKGSVVEVQIRYETRQRRRGPLWRAQQGPPLGSCHSDSGHEDILHQLARDASLWDTHQNLSHKARKLV